MRRTLLLTLVLLPMIAGALTVLAQGRPDEAAVIVNGEPISTWEIGLLIPQIQSEMAAQGVEPKGEVVIRTALQRAIDSKLMAQEARRRGLKPNEERIDGKLNAFVEGSGGRAALEAELIKTGVTYAQLRATVVQADLVQTLVETEIGAGIEIPAEDVAAFVGENPDLFKGQDKIHTRHILFKIASDADAAERDAGRGRAEAARERALAGEDFASLAIELSEGPNASRGGDLGFTARGQMVESFDNAVWALEVGEISEVVESRLGFHVIKVEEIVIGQPIPMNEARPLVEDLLRQQHTAAIMSELLAELKASAEIHDPK